MYIHIVSFLQLSQPDLPQRASLVAETSTIEIQREDPEEELGMRIVGGKDTPLGNIVVQEILRDSVVATDGRIAPGDHILEVGLSVDSRIPAPQPAQSSALAPVSAGLRPGVLALASLQCNPHVVTAPASLEQAPHVAQSQTC